MKNQTSQSIAHSIQKKFVQQLVHWTPRWVPTGRTTHQVIRVHSCSSSLRALSFYLRNSFEGQFQILSDIAAIDTLKANGRFTLNYHFLSLARNSRLCVVLRVSETAVISSLAAPFTNRARLFAGASWLEREVWDMFGCYFSQHGDLRRILTDYGFTGHPLRKDFPLSGFIELSYSNVEGRVISGPVRLDEAFRVFHF